MSDAIRIDLTPDTLQARPDGGPAEAAITVQNLGAAVDQYAVELDGLPTAWYNLSATAVALFPQDKEEAKLVIRPPKGNGVKAGTYPFQVTAVSRADASQSSRAEGTLQVGAIIVFELDMAPKKVIGRKGRYKLALRNGGNADVTVEFEAIDAEEELRYRFKPDMPQLAPGQRQTSVLTVKPRRGGLVGARKNYDFQVKVKPSLGDSKTLQGQLVHTPRFRTWKPIRRFVLLIIVLAALLILAQARGGIPGLHRDVQRIQAAISGVLCRAHLFCSPAAQPRYINGFKDFHVHAPALIGRPLEDEHRVANRFIEQMTTGGLLVYDQKDGRCFFIPHRSAIVYERDHGRTRVLAHA